MVNFKLEYIFIFICLNLFISCSNNESSTLQEIEQEQKEQSCDSPINLSFDNITGSTVEISWIKTDNNDSFEIEYGEKGFTIGSGIKTSSTTNSIEITGLAISTDYQIYIRAKCSSNFSNYSEIENFSTPCDNGLYPERLTLTTQKEVEDFGKLCYTGIDGWLRLVGLESDDPITDISSLISLKEIQGVLDIVSNDELINLNGLDSLKIVSDIGIFDNSNLVSIEGLRNIQEIAGSREPIFSNAGPGIRIYYNPKLETLKGLEKIKEVGQLEIVENVSLKSLQGLENLERALEGVRILVNNSLENLNDISNLKSVGTSLWVSSNSKLTNLIGLDNLTSIPNELKIVNNSNLKSIASINIIDQINQIYIGDNESLNSLEGLNIEVVNQFLYITDNNSLLTLDGISGNFSDSYIIINENNNLQSLAGMENITELNSLDVTRNNKIISLDGIDNLLSISGDIRFIENPLLVDYCAVTNLINEGIIEGEFVSHDNAYDTSVELIQTGNCEQ